MRIIQQPNKFVLRALGMQTAEDGLQYRLSRFVVTEGDAAYNCLTGEALSGADEATQIARWFRVPADMDETMLAYQVRQNWLQTARGPGQSVKTKYVIFLTTACNASCEYCYEKGVRTMTMTEQTAHDVANYILIHSDPNAPPNIRWFGGEPLCNVKAIDIIADTLNEAGLGFSSEIFTNGDLFQDISDDQIKNWHLRKIQLTVDDTGPEYERIKGLPPGAYNRICETVDRMSGLGITINLRIHVRPGHGADAPLRVAQRFCGIPNVFPYCNLLYSGGTESDYADLFAVQEYIDRNGGRRIRFPDVRIGYSCMAENRKTACITTDGHLSPCEHHPYGQDYGSIYHSGYDQTVLKRWAAKSRNYCDGCVLYPSCGKQRLCPAEGKCSPAEIQHQVNRIRYALREAT